MRKGFLAALFLSICAMLPAQAINNDTVIKMVKAGLTDDVIITTINASAATFDTSPDGLIALKQAGASDKVIAAVVAKSAPAAPAAPTDVSAATAPAPPAPPLPPGIDSMGVYYQDSGGNWQMLPGEVVVFESGGLVKHVATAGLVKHDLNGVVGGMRSRLVVKTPATFIVHLPEGRSPNDYRLFRLHVAGNNRQFQSAAGELGHESTSGARDDIEYLTKEVGPSAYQVVLNGDLGDGEFGFLEPQDTGSKAPPSSGKIFTFAVVN
jgi:hypothetical protein